jgi:hypothetical protein
MDAKRIPPADFCFKKFVGCIIDASAVADSQVNDECDSQEAHHSRDFTCSDSLAVINISEPRVKKRKTRDRRQTLIGIEKMANNSRQNFLLNGLSMSPAQLYNLCREMVEENEKLSLKIKEYEEILNVMERTMTDLSEKNRKLTGNIIMSMKSKREAAANLQSFIVHPS